MDSFSFKLKDELVNKFIDFYKEYQKESTNESVAFFALFDNLNITLYKNSTVLITGKKAYEESTIWNRQEYFDSMGSDEVGCGDYFGPVVVCSTIVYKDKIDELIKLGVRDSKKLSDEKIEIIAKKIMELIPYCVFTLTNNKYNELTYKGYNLNKIKSYCHNFVLSKLQNKEKYNGKIVIDQFCEENLYYKYLLDSKEKVLKGITFECKADANYLSVAAASIIARYTFLTKIKEMESKIGEKIILGSNEKVNELAFNLSKRFGFESLNEFVKLHFKNTNQIKEMY